MAPNEMSAVRPQISKIIILPQYDSSVALRKSTQSYNAVIPAWVLRHETFGLEVADHLGSLRCGQLSINMNETLSIRFQNRDDLLALIDFELRHQLSA